MTAMPQTEASCLLASGTLYRVRAGLTTESGDGPLVFAGFKKGAFSLYFGDAPIYHFDLEGRWQRAYIGPTHYLKGLDGRVHAIDRVREGPNLVLRRRVLGPDEVRAFDLQLCDVAASLLDELARGRFGRHEPPPGKARPLEIGELRAFLERIAGWDATAWDAHRTAYHEAYVPLPFLPPECQNAVVLQATCGNAGGNAFGGGPASEHVVRSPEVFADHVDQVVRLFGRRLDQSRVVFLAGSDVLRLPPEHVVRCLDAICERLPIRPGADDEADPTDGPSLDGAYVFLDDFSTPLPGPEALASFRERHLLHVSLGVESGAPAIRRLYGRNWSDEDLRRFLADLRSAGLGVSFMTLVGAGGPEHAGEHVAATAALLGSLDLCRGDMVFLLDERELRGDGTPGTAPSFLDGEAWAAQQSELKRTLAPLRERGIKVLPYSLEKQWG
jgi:hypothetical protein